MKQAYKSIEFRAPALALIKYIDVLVGQYQQQGYMLSVRQIYYQLVARDKVPNTEQSYKRVAGLINDGRLAGLIDWDAIEDRGRDIEVRSRWTSGASIIRAVAQQYHMDMWVGQDTRVFCIVEKAALAGVLGGVCRRFDVPLLAARGYPSVSVVRELVRDHVQPALDAGQSVLLLHLGDHDPSGIDMTRDLTDRIALFEDAGSSATVRRIALSMAQIEEKEPPPNPAKVTDSRFADYEARYGSESWELDALEPSYLEALVTRHVEAEIDVDVWKEREDEIETIRERLTQVADDFAS